MWLYVIGNSLGGNRERLTVRIYCITKCMHTFIRISEEVSFVSLFEFVIESIGTISFRIIVVVCDLNAQYTHSELTLCR